MGVGSCVCGWGFGESCSPYLELLVWCLVRVGVLVLVWSLAARGMLPSVV